MTTTDNVGTGRGVSRRDLLKRGAVVGVAAAWTVPLVQVVSMTPAHADTPSAPPTAPTNAPPTPETTAPTSAIDPATSSAIDGVFTTRPYAATTTGGSAAVAGANISGTSSTLSTKSALAYTGANTMPTIGIGAAAIALGVGAVAASQVGKSKSAEVTPAESE